MEYRKLELNIISAKDIKDVNLFSKMDVYAVVSIAGDPLHPQSATTNIHKDGGTSPTWNFPVKFVFNESLAQQNRLSLEVKLVSDRKVTGDTVIGTVHVPLKELLDNPGDGGESYRQISYQVKKLSGKPQGTFNFSYKLGEKVDAPATKAAAGKASHQEPVMAYPPTAAGSSSVPYGTPQPPPGHGYPPQQPGYGYPPQQQGYGYPPQQPDYGYPPQQPGYGYPPQQPGYGYPPQQAGYGYPPQQPGYGYPAGQKPAKKKNKLGMGLGAGLLGGALGGMILGDMVSDAGDYDAGFDDAGGFDF